jgi:hypothetical protein
MEICGAHSQHIGEKLRTFSGNTCQQLQDDPGKQDGPESKWPNGATNKVNPTIKNCSG